MEQSTVEFPEIDAVDIGRKTIRVLHVDDDAGFLKTAKAILEMQGAFQVDTAACVEEAAEKMKKEEYDAVVCDYQMPQKDGLQFLKELRIKGNRIPFIMFTGKGREEVAIKALNLGADGYFNKSGHAETVYGELTHGILQTVEKRRAEQSFLKSEDKYRRLVETLHEGIWAIDKDSYTTFVNPRMAEILGYDTEEMKGRSLFSFMDERDVEIAKRFLERRRQGIKEQHDFEFLRKDGKRVYAALETSPITDDNGNYLGALASVMDITERKEAEQEIVVRDKAMASSIDGMAIANLQGNVTYVNPAFVRMWGYDNAKEIQGKTIAEMTRKGQSKETADKVVKALETKGEWTGEIVATRKDGSKFYVRVSANIVKDEAGKPICMLSSFKDITESKNLTESLRSSEERLRILYEIAPDGYYLIDLKGNLLDGNKAAEKITGYARSELIGKSFLKLKLLPRSQMLKATKLLALNALGKPAGPDELVLNRKDGTQVPVEIRTHPVRINDQTLVLEIARDITERKRTENLVLENQQKFEGLFRGSPEATVFLDSSFHVLDISPRFTSLFGYTLDEVRGKDVNDVIAMKNMMEEAKRLDEKAIKGYVYHDTVRMRKDGSLVPVSISAAPILIQGKLTGYIGIYKDISQLKKAEEELHEAVKKSQVMNEKLRVVCGLTRHDVRNKLAAVAGNTHLVRKKLPDKSEVLHYLKQIETCVEETVRILEFAKAYEMLGVEELTYIDMEKTVNEAVSLFSGLKDVKVMNDCHGVTVLADSLLRTLFYNLVDNSLKYGEKLSQIRVYYQKKNDDLKVIYEDDGVGIPQAVKSKLFADRYTTGKGSGYGLYLIRKMMEVYGWTVQETGILGRGARFVITIPRVNGQGKETYQLH